MKFGKTFESYLTTEWRQQYMNYSDLKAMIYKAVQECPSTRNASNALILQYFLNFEGIFFARLHEELLRVQNFYAQKIAEARRKLYIIVQQLKARTSTTSKHGPSTRNLPLACTEFYLSLIMLQNFQSLNYTAFRKICKKYDKNLKSDMGGFWFEEYVTIAPFAQDKELQSMIGQVEELYTVHFTKGDRAKAMDKLRVPPLGQCVPPSKIFMAGMVLGLCIVSTAIVIISLYYIHNQLDVITIIAQLYRGPIASSLATFLFALNVYVWQNKGVNHVLIFNIDLRNHLSAAAFLEVASIVGYIVTMSMVFFIHYKEFEVDTPYYFPVLCIILPFLMLVNPTPIMNRRARMWILRMIGRILGAPFYKVVFPDFWMADQLTSLTVCMVDYYQLIRFYYRYCRGKANVFEFEPDTWITLIRCLPSWFRLSQCLRRYYDNDYKKRKFILNTIKYFINIIVVIASTIVMETNHNYDSMFDNPWIWFYISMSVISTIYSTAWDFLSDFGLFKVWKGENIFLRNNLVYSKWFYYNVMALNVLIRFAWSLEMYLIYFDYVSAFSAKTISSFLEILRRFFWNFIRLENEHLNNVGEFRATRDIYLHTISMTDLNDDDKKLS
ncbi:xenotropic and polytropic retrovirus receptor 1-like [Drosophila albomicans]|uniref:Xenotropic and polytropic retrovirus receptor 1-like n=1 Tax=Drosophila albomicans TaxID=7291 RepID=A0A9C6SN32_DROAB|nr:xenotropic and polytropic retrovirus receptor 1-like [Drosophila albomicans]